MTAERTEQAEQVEPAEPMQKSRPGDGNALATEQAQTGAPRGKNSPTAERAQNSAPYGKIFPVKKTAFLCRAMRPEDVPACAAIEAAVSDGWSAGALAEELSQPTARLFVAEALNGSGAPAPHSSPPPQIAALAVFQLVCEEASLYTVSTAPALRRQGAARALLQYAFAQLAAQWAQMVFLEVRAQNKAARALYTALGFEETGTRRGFYAKPNDDAVLMQKAIGN